MASFGYFTNLFSKLYARIKFPHYNQFMEAYKMPSNPKIVVFGNSPVVNSLISNQFANFNKLDGKTLPNESDEKLALAVAENVLKVKEDLTDGFVITDFPNNENQAEKLDVILDGVNLAIFFKDNANKEYNEKITPLLNYYNLRGSLLEFPVDANADAQSQSAKLRDAIIANIKL